MLNNLNKALILVSIPIAAVFILTIGNLVDTTFLQHSGIWILSIAFAAEGGAVWIFREQDNQKIV